MRHRGAGSCECPETLGHHCTMNPARDSGIKLAQEAVKPRAEVADELFWTSSFPHPAQFWVASHLAESTDAWLAARLPPSLPRSLPCSLPCFIAPLLHRSLAPLAHTLAVISLPMHYPTYIKLFLSGSYSLTLKCCVAVLLCCVICCVTRGEARGPGPLRCPACSS